MSRPLDPFDWDVKELPGLPGSERRHNWQAVVFDTATREVQCKSPVFVELRDADKWAESVVGHLRRERARNPNFGKPQRATQSEDSDPQVPA